MVFFSQLNVECGPLGSPAVGFNPRESVSKTFESSKMSAWEIFPYVNIWEYFPYNKEGLWH
jgi:hypothetical protein